MNRPEIHSDDILVRAQDTPNPNAIKFIINYSLKDVGNATFTSAEQADALPASEKHYLYPEGDNMLYMQAPERYMNHSCGPNTHVVGKSDVASRNIEPGEEITSDYMDLETENFVCNCGSPNCRSKTQK